MPADSSDAGRSSRFATGVFACLLALFLLLAYGIYRHLAERDEMRAEQTLGHTADMQSAAVAGWAVERLGDAHAFSSDQFLGEAVQAWMEHSASQEAVRRRIQAQLRAIKSSYGYLDVTVVDSNGVVLISSEDNHAPLGEPVLRTAMNAARTNVIRISPIHASTSFPQASHLVSIAAPLSPASGKSERMQAILILSANVDIHIEALVEPVPLLNAATEVVLAEEREGRVIVTVADKNTTFFRDLEALPITLEQFSAHTVWPMRPVLLQTTDGRTVIAAARKIPVAPWYLVAMFDQAASRANVNRLAWVVAGAGIALLLLFALVARIWWKGRESRHRLQMLQAASEKEALQRQSETALRQSQEKLDSILASILDVVWSFSASLRMLNYINPSVERIYGYPPAAFLDRPQLWFDGIHPEDRERVHGLLAGLTPELPMCDIEYRVVHADGSVRWVQCRGRLVPETEGESPRIDGVTSDITERKAAEQQVQQLAYFDNVTKLPNRTLLQDRLAQAMHIAQRNRRKVALLFMDLDNFKHVNDSLGHQIGDLLLQTIGERLVACVRSEDTVARIGGDEFLIVLSDLDKGTRAVAVAEKILASAARPFLLRDHQIHTTISIGIGIFPDDAQELHELVRHADAALYQAKGRGRNNYQFFTQELNYQITRSATIERELRLAIDTRTGRMIGAEALLRWRNGQHDFLSPVEFIPVAEERGLISSIGEWVLREACAQCRRWHEKGLRTVPLAVNVSPIHFQQKGFAELVIGVLDESGLDASCLELEITESAVMQRASQVAELAMRLREIGVGISIDDFGTGYSSLSYLKQIPIDKIKIDRSFIKDMMHDDDDEAIAYAIINLAHSLKLRVIAEGVESREQVDRLRTFGCDEVQGYFYSSAVPAAEFERYLMADPTFPQKSAVMPH